MTVFVIIVLAVAAAGLITCGYYAGMHRAQRTRRPSEHGPRVNPPWGDK